MEQKNKEIALAIGTLLIGSGYERLMVALAAIKESDFVDVDTAIKESDTVLGPMSLFEKTAHAFCARAEESLKKSVDELTKHVCPTCPVDHDCASPNAPCKDLRVQAEMASQAHEMVFDSIRKRFGDIPSIGIRSGFIAVKCPSKAREIGIEIIEVNGSRGGLGDLLGAIFKSKFGGRSQ